MRGTDPQKAAQEAAACAQAARIVAREFGVAQRCLLQRRHVGPIWQARATFYWLLASEQLLGLSFRRIAAYCGRQHSSPRYTVARLHRLRGLDADFHAKVVNCEQQFAAWIDAGSPDLTTTTTANQTAAA